MTSVRVLGLCGLLASLLTACGGFAEVPCFVGLSGAVMVFGNLFALVSKK